MLDVTKLKKDVPIPLYFQLKELLLAEITKGTYQTGEAIPTEKELSEMFQISRTTVRQAISELEHKGWLNRMKSKGTFVSKPKFHQNFTNALESYNDQIIKSGRVVLIESVVSEPGTERRTGKSPHRITQTTPSEKIRAARRPAAGIGVSLLSSTW